MPAKKTETKVDTKVSKSDTIGYIKLMGRKSEIGDRWPKIQQAAAIVFTIRNYDMLEMTNDELASIVTGSQK